MAKDKEGQQCFKLATKKAVDMIKWTGNETVVLQVKEDLMTGLEIATNTVAFATKFFALATKISGEVANL